MNTAISPHKLPLKYAPHLENMFPSYDDEGAIGARYGLNKEGVAIGWGEIKLLTYYTTPTSSVDLVAYCDDGTEARIYTSGDYGATWTLQKSGLTTGGVTYTTAFDNKLVIVNGLDDNMYWDGTSINIIGEYVKDQFSNGVHVDTTTIKFDPYKGADHDFAAGTPVKVTFSSSGEISATVASVSYTDPTLTITIDSAVFPATTETITEIKYYDKPEPFGFITAAHDRLWALIGGSWKAQTFRSGSKGLYVYYTDISNSVNAWFNAITQEVSYINMEDKAAVFDEFVGISQQGTYTIFHGRNHLQVWNGVDPGTLGGFTWVRNIPVGTLHGRSIQSIGNDVVFFTKYGIRTLRNVFTSAELEVSGDVGASVDPTVQKHIDYALSSDTNYRNVCAWSYERDGMYGFRVGDKSLVFSVGDEVRGWVLFSGKFSSITSGTDTPKGVLLITVGDQVYSYANGVDGSAVYTDDGSIYPVIWQTAWLELPRRWANNHIEIVVRDGTDVQDLTVYRFKNNSTTDVTQFTVSVDATFPEWDVADWDTSYWTAGETTARKRDKCLVDSIAYKIERQSDAGKLEIVKLILGGR